MAQPERGDRLQNASCCGSMLALVDIGQSSVPTQCRCRPRCPRKLETRRDSVRDEWRGPSSRLQRPLYFERSPEPLEAAARTLLPTAGFADLFASAFRARDS